MEVISHCLTKLSTNCGAYHLSRCRCFGLDTGIALSLQAGST